MTSAEKTHVLNVLFVTVVFDLSLTLLKTHVMKKKRLNRRLILALYMCCTRGVVKYEQTIRLLEVALNGKWRLPI